MAITEVILFWIAVFVYAASFSIHLFSFVRQKPDGINKAVPVLWVGWVVHTAAGIVRWIAEAHPPVTDTYELNLTGAWFAILLFLVFERIKKLDRSVALVVTPVCFLLMGYGYMGRTEATPMSPAYDSPWLILHVIFAWLAFGCFLIAVGAAVMLLLKERNPGKKLPEPDALDLMSYRYIVLGFINHTIMLLAGTLWAKKLWGHYWSWDPLETWSLITFLYYVFYLHARRFFHWKGKRTAWLAILGLVILAISFWGVKYFVPSVHPGI